MGERLVYTERVGSSILSPATILNISMRQDTKNGHILFPEEYCILNNTLKITEEDCFCQIKSNTETIKNWFEKDFDFSLLDNNIPNFHVWKHHHLSPEDSRKIITENETLSSIDKIIKIHHCLIMEVSKNSWVAWHYDFPRKGPVLNLVLTPDAHSHSLFTGNLPDTSNLIECKYYPDQFCLYNTDIIHSVTNFDKTRYLFSVVFERGMTDLSWEESKKLLREFII